MVRSLLLLFALLFSAWIGFSQTVLSGKVTDEQGEALIGAPIKIVRGSDPVRGTMPE